MWLRFSEGVISTQVSLTTITGVGTARHCVDLYSALFCYYLLGGDTRMSGAL